MLEKTAITNTDSVTRTFWDLSMAFMECGGNTGPLVKFRHICHTKYQQFTFKRIIKVNNNIL